MAVEHNQQSKPECQRRLLDILRVRSGREDKRATGSQTQPNQRVGLYFPVLVITKPVTMDETEPRTEAGINLTPDVNAVD
jgi:hypothetical protein